MAGPFPCPNPPSPCDTNPNPATQFSSEAQDSTTFIGIAWNGNTPPLNKPFNLVPCEAIAESQVSQADADRQAQNAAVLCSSPCTAPFQNTVQTASGQCADGSPYFLTVAAGLYTADNQVLADRLAFTAAARALIGHSICLGSLAPVSVCRDEFYFGQISVVTTDGPATMSLIAGELPDGLSIRFESDRAVIQGSPVSFGTTTFTLLATSAAGVFTSKTYQVIISGILTGSGLADGTVDTGYSVQLQAVLPPGSSPMWSVISGSLPDGLELDGATGQISGTPTTSENSSFTIGVTAAGNTCQKAFTLHVSGGSPVISCITPTGASLSIPGNPDFEVNQTRSATYRRLAVPRSADGIITFVDTSTNTIINNTVTDVVVNGNPGVPSGTFATSVGHWFFCSASGGLNVFDVDGNFIVNIAFPANVFPHPSAMVYSPTQDRVYVVAVDTGTVGNTDRILEINPHTNAITNNVDIAPITGSVYAGYYPDKVVVQDNMQVFHVYTLPTITPLATYAVNAFQVPLDYAVNAGRVLFGSGSAPATIAQINPAAFTLEHTYTAASTNGFQVSVFYNPITGAIITGGNDGSIMIIDPVAENIVCELVAPGTVIQSGFGIDYFSGDVYQFNVNFADNPLTVYH